MPSRGTALFTPPLPWSCHSRRSRHAGHVDKIISSAPFPGAAGEHAANSQRMPDCGRPTHPDPTSRGKAARFYYEPMIQVAKLKQETRRCLAARVRKVE